MWDAVKNIRLRWSKCGAEDILFPKYLARYVRENGYAGICSYCGVHTMVIDLTDFIDYVGNRLVDYLGPMDNEGLFLDSSFMDDDGIPGFIKRGPYITPADAEYYENIYQYMEDYKLITYNNKLNEDIANCFMWIIGYEGIS